MSLSHETMIELMQYADGELDGEARARVEALLRTSDEARGVVDAMGALGEVVREGVGDRVDQSANVDGIADAVMSAIEREPGKVAPIGQARRARTGVTSAVVAALALAAGVVFFVTSRAPAPVAKEEPVPSAPVAQTPEPVAPSASQALAQTETPGVDLEEVRSIRNKVDVFFTPTASAAGAKASVVVWIDDRHGGH
jgi:anti-sigma factor RsiW